MKTAINKLDAIAAMLDEAGTTETRTRAGILVALIEIREEIGEGIEAINEHARTANVAFLTCIESVDTFVRERIQADKTIEALLTALVPKAPEKKETPEKSIDEPKKPAVTLNVGNFGGPISDAGVL